VESVPLITASIMSKKFAEGAQSLVFDVKTGSGAFMKSREEARRLALSLLSTAKVLGRGVAVLITDMDQPLGRKVGNFLEVEESIDCLRGAGPPDLVELTVRLAARMLVLGGVKASPRDAVEMARARLADGSAWERFVANVELQGGDTACVLDPAKGPHARVQRPARSRGRGFVARVDAHGVGAASVILGAGRSRKGEAVLPGVGITLLKVQGDPVKAGDEVALVLGEDPSRVEEAVRLTEEAYSVSEERIAAGDLVLEEIAGP
jgi:pyrimidine-nucleoside phosphorylase